MPRKWAIIRNLRKDRVSYRSESGLCGIRGLADLLYVKTDGVRYVISSATGRLSKRLRLFQLDSDGVIVFFRPVWVRVILVFQVWEGRWRVIPFHVLPEWLKDNDYLLHGHRPPMPSFRACFGSIFRIHTETGNIWTHLLGECKKDLHDKKRFKAGWQRFNLQWGIFPVALFHALARH